MTSLNRHFLKHFSTDSSEIMVTDVILMLRKVLKVSCRYLSPFLSYRENPVEGAESTPPPQWGACYGDYLLAPKRFLCSADISIVVAEFSNSRRRASPVDTQQQRRPPHTRSRWWLCVKDTTALTDSHRALNTPAYPRVLCWRCDLPALRPGALQPFCHDQKWWLETFFLLRDYRPVHEVVQSDGGAVTDDSCRLSD